MQDGSAGPAKIVGLLGNDTAPPAVVPSPLGQYHADGEAEIAVASLLETLAKEARKEAAAAAAASEARIGQLATRIQSLEGNCAEKAASDRSAREADSRVRESMGAQIAKLVVGVEEARKRATEASAATDAKIDQLMARLEKVSAEARRHAAASSAASDESQAVQLLLARVQQLEDQAAAQNALPAKVEKLEKLVAAIRKKMRKLLGNNDAVDPGTGGSSATDSHQGPSRPAPSTIPSGGPQTHPASGPSRPPVSFTISAGGATPQTPGPARPPPTTTAPTEHPLDAFFGTNILKRLGQMTRTSSALSGKDVIGIYIGRQACGACRSFMPKLIERYKGLKAAGKNIEIVFSSCDFDEASFKEFYKGMPWCALPYSSPKHGQLRSRFFQGEYWLPALVLVDASGALITDDGAHSSLMSPSYIQDYPYKTAPAAQQQPSKPGGPQTHHPAGPSRPPVSTIPAGGATPSRPPPTTTAPTEHPLDAFFGANILKQLGKMTRTSSALSGKDVIGIYIGRHACGACTSFMPKLIERYKGLKAAGKNIEIVFSSCDFDEASFKEFYKGMPWCALPYSSPKNGQLRSRFFHQGRNMLPKLILVDASGALITDDGAHSSLMSPSYIQDYPYKTAPAAQQQPSKPPAQKPAKPPQQGAPAISRKGTKRALLVGCRYPDTQNALHGCWNDVKIVGDLLVNVFQFPKGETVKDSGTPPPPPPPFNDVIFTFQRDNPRLRLP